MMAKPGRTGLNRIFWAARHTVHGVKAAFKHEAAFRQEIVLGLALIPFAYFFAQSALHIWMLVISFSIILVTELLNSAVEAVVDRISNDHHELSGRAKDMGSAAVAIAFVPLCVVVLQIIASHFYQ